MPYETPSRRSFLHLASASTLPLFWNPATGFANPPERPQLIVRQQMPQNMEFPFQSLNSFITPNELFYVRNHFPIPQLTANNYRLRVEGLVENQLNLTFDDIRRMPSRTVTFTMECAGNSRALLTPPARGVPWQYGAVSTAEWTGVPLSAVLQRAGVRDNATEVICEGADEGRLTSQPGPAGQPIHFTRGLPMAQTRRNDVLLAYRMNGQDLPAAHGFPLRLVVPGWYGMASVKWLSRLVLTNRPFTGYYQSLAYIRFHRVQGSYVITPITVMPVKSLIAQPITNARLQANANVRIHGAAWCGDSAIRRVNVSTDGGQTWQQARLLGEARDHCWRLWEYNWRTPARPGRVTLMSRATNARGDSQPMMPDGNRGAYMINHVIPVPVQVGE